MKQMHIRLFSHQFKGGQEAPRMLSLPEQYMQYFKLVFIVSILCALGLSFVHKDNDISILYWQTVSIISSIVFIMAGLRIKLKQTLLLIFVFQTLLSLVLYIYFRNLAETSFGYDAVDALLYQEIANNTYQGSWSDFLREMEKHRLGLPDFGYPVFLRFFYSISPSPAFANFLLIGFNCVCQTVTCYFVLKLSGLMNFSYIEKKWTVLLWGINVCSVYLNVSGLKEPLFVMICTITAYYICKFASDKNLRNFLGFLIFVTLTWFFRNYMTIFFLLTFLGCTIFNKIYTKAFGWIVIFSIFSAIALQNLMTYVFPEIYYAIMATEEALPGGIMKYVYYIMAFLGPIPRFFSNKYPIVLMVTGYCLIKFYYSIFAVAGSYYMIKLKEYKFYPLITLSLLTVIMLIVSGHFTEFRYFYPIAPCFFILIIRGFRYCSSNLKYSYLLFASLTILAFELRG